MTVLFKEGIHGNKQEAIENIARWAKRLKIEKEMNWIGKPKGDRQRRSKAGIERKIAEWMLDPETRYPWEKKKEETEMETHEQFLSMAGIIYYSLKENWNKASNEEKRIKGIQQKITKVLFTTMPERLEYRQRYIQAVGIQAGYRQKRRNIK